MRAAYRQLAGPVVDHATNFLIGGTNGKGSTAGFLYLLLTQNQSLRIGLYTSPHLLEFSERISLSHRKMTDKILHHEFQKMKKKVPKEVLDSLSFFEITTLLAAYLFAGEDNHLNIWEVGLGGRLDATNVISPSVSAIVSISRDHEEFLGEDLWSIALEKLGIARSQRPLFFGSGGELSRNPCLLERFHQETQARSVPVYDFGSYFTLSDDSFQINLPHLKYQSLPLPHFLQKGPKYLKQNYVLAASMYHWQQSYGTEKLKPIEEANGSLVIHSFPPSLAARCEKRQIEYHGSQYQIIMDVCHNPDGAQTFTSALREVWQEDWPETLPGMVFIFADKKMNAMLDHLKKILFPLSLFHLNGSNRDFNDKDIAPRHQDITVYPSFKSAWEDFKNISSDPTVICGSVWGIGSVLDFFATEKMARHHHIPIGNSHWLQSGW